MPKADDVLLFDVVLSILLFAFGASTGVANINTFTTFQSPKLAPSPTGSFAQCQNTDAGCISQNLVLATAYVGWALVNLPVLLIFVIQLFFTFGNSVLNVVFAPSTSPNGVPFLGIFFTGLQFYVLWEVIRTFRGSSTGV